MSLPPAMRKAKTTNVELEGMSGNLFLLVNNSCVIFAVSGDYCQVIPVGNTCMIVGDH
jgi:hypothetical protein